MPGGLLPHTDVGPELGTGSGDAWGMQDPPAAPGTGPRRCSTPQRDLAGASVGVSPPSGAEIGKQPEILSPEALV